MELPPAQSASPAKSDRQGYATIGSMELRLGGRAFGDGEFAVMTAGAVPGADIAEVGPAEVRAVRAAHPGLVIAVTPASEEEAVDAVRAGADLLIGDAYVNVAAATGAALLGTAGVHGTQAETRLTHAEDLPSAGRNDTERVGDHTRAEDLPSAEEHGARKDDHLPHAADLPSLGEHGVRNARAQDLPRTGRRGVREGGLLVCARDVREAESLVGAGHVVFAEEEALAVVAVYAWLGVRVFRTDDVPGTRQVLDMVASIKGTRPPSVTRRGLA